MATPHCLDTSRRESKSAFGRARRRIYAAPTVGTQVANDPYSEHAQTRLVEATPDRAVTEQPGLRELDNHLAIRHASALYTTMYAASRALVLAAVGETPASARLAESVTTYPYVPVGLITSVAEPDGDGWESLTAELDAGRAVELAASVTASNDDGRTVATLAATWRVEPAAGPAGGAPAGG
jgi:hypothetical protein